MRLLIALTALTMPTVAQAQGPAGRDEEMASAFRDTRDEAERNLLFGPNGRRPQLGRLALATYGKCVSEREPQESRRLLTVDFNSRAYTTSLRLLSQDAEEDCAPHAVKLGEKMGFGNLLFAGAIAEAMLEADATPINLRLARVGGVKAETFGPTDAISQCLSRSLPDAVAALFATEPEASAETAAAQPLLQAVPACSRAVGVTARVELSVAAVRAMTATAAYRLLLAPR